MVTKKKNRKTIAIGVMALVALLFFYFGFNFLKGINLFERTTSYYVTFQNAKDITKSTPVTFDGYRIGLVRSLAFDYEGLRGVTAELALDNNVKIPKGCKVAVKSNPLSGAELSLVKPKNISNFHAPGDTLQAFSSSDLLSQVSDDLLPAIAGMINKMDTLLYNFDRIIGNPHITKAFKEISLAAENMRFATSSLRTMMSDRVPRIMGNVESTMYSLSSLTHELDSLQLEATITKLNGVLANTEALTERMKSPDNTLGLLLNDKKLYVNITDVTKSADSLLVDLRKNPKRYVSFSLF